MVNLLFISWFLYKIGWYNQSLYPVMFFFRLALLISLQVLAISKLSRETLNDDQVGSELQRKDHDGVIMKRSISLNPR